jgi:signal transduction histidine kinase
VLALFATAATTLAVAALALLPPLEARLRSDAARTLVLRAEAARAGFERLRPGQSPTRALRALARTTGAQVLILDGGGIRGETDPDEPGSLADANTALITRHSRRSVHRGIADAAVPLRYEGVPAALYLRRHLGDVRRTFSVVADAFAGAALAGLGLALVAGIALSGRMLRRLRALSDAMLAADPVLAPAEVDTARDELGELARAFAGLQQRLAQQEDARRMFVATASHELKTPLSSLQALLELTVDETDPDLIKRDVREALAQTERLTGLSKSLLDLSKLDAGAPLRSEPIELGELSRAVAAEFDRPTWIEPDEPCWASGDPEGVARIVRLLVDNAVRYAPAPAPVEVRAERRNGHARVRVLDGGAGIPETERDVIFERFQRGGNTTAPGFGLGLAIGAELARRMNGELRLEEGGPAPGEPAGARFVLILPHA